MLFERLSRFSVIAVRILAVVAVVLLVAQARGDEPAEAGRHTFSLEDLDTKLDQLLFRSRPDLVVEIDSVTQIGTFSGDPRCHVKLRVTNVGGGPTLFNNGGGIVVTLNAPVAGGFDFLGSTSFQMPLNDGDIFAGNDASFLRLGECPADPLVGTVTVDPTSPSRPMGRFPELDEGNNTTQFSKPVIFR